jgi:hypothetical protein
MATEVELLRKLAELGISITDPDTGEGAKVNADGQLHIVGESMLCTVNSTTDTLGAGISWVGDAVSLASYNGIALFVTSDVASAPAGLEVQYSKDGLTNWRTAESYTILAGAEKWFTPPTFGIYFRLKYTNGGSAQGSFELTTKLSKFSFKWSSHNVDEPVSDQDDATLTKAVITGKSPDNEYRNANVTTDGNLSISDESSGLSIARGNVTDAEFVHKFGSAPDFDIVDGFVTIWDAADDGAAWERMRINYSDSADIDSISSSSNADDQEVEIQGLDLNHELNTQYVTLNGQTRVALETNLIRVFRVKNANNSDFAGHVIAYVNTAISGGVPIATGNIRAVVQQDNNQTEMAVYTIPDGKTGYMRSWYASTSGARQGSSHVIKLRARPYGGVFQLKHKTSIIESGTSYVQHGYVEPEVFQPRTDIEMRANSDVNAGNVSAGFDIVLIENDEKWTPSEITTIAWYDPSDSDTVQDTGGLVDQLDDKSGNNYHLTQTGTARPTTGVELFGALNGLGFDGTDDYLENASFAVPDSGNLAVFLIARVNTVDATSDSLISYDNGNDFQYDANDISDFLGRINVNGIGSDVSLTGGPFNLAYLHNINFDYTSGYYNAYVSGTQRAVNTTYSAKLGTSGTLRLAVNRGTSAFIQCKIGEIIITEDASEATRLKIEGYLSWKWEAVDKLPGSHPYKYFPPTVQDKT